MLGRGHFEAEKGGFGVTHLSFWLSACMSLTARRKSPPVLLPTISR